MGELVYKDKVLKILSYHMGSGYRDVDGDFVEPSICKDAYDDVVKLQGIKEVSYSDMVSKKDILSLPRNQIRDYRTSALVDETINIKDIKELLSVEPKRKAMKWKPCDKPPKGKTDVLIRFEENLVVGFYSGGLWNINVGNGIYQPVTSGEEQPIEWINLRELGIKDEENM